MAAVIYGLCAVTCVLCAGLLLLAYRRNRYRLLLWGGLCFVGLSLTNGILIVDKIFLPESVDLSVWRHSVTLVSLSVLIYGLIWEGE